MQFGAFSGQVVNGLPRSRVIQGMAAPTDVPAVHCFLGIAKSVKIPNLAETMRIRQVSGNTQEKVFQAVKHAIINSPLQESPTDYTISHVHGKQLMIADTFSGHL